MIILGLGSNIGDRQHNLDGAIRHIEEALLKNIIRSGIHEFPPLLPEGAGKDWNSNFLNMVIGGTLKTEITPHEFLHIIKGIEEKLGRKKSARWAPREIDIDILAWDNLVFETDDLKIPHYSIAERDFVLIPLLEIAPEWQHPVTGTKAREYLEKLEK